MNYELTITGYGLTGILISRNSQFLYRNYFSLIPAKHGHMKKSKKN